MTKDSRAQTAAVEVALRIRPLTDRDRAQPRFASISEDDVLRAQNNAVHIVSHGKSFHFDHVFRPSCTQSEIFASIGDKLVRKFVDGYNVTILAYGQTSSGKTYTMGTEKQQTSHNMEQEGIVPRAVSLLFDLLQQIDTRPSSPSSSCSSASRPQSRIRPLTRLLPPPSSTSANNNGASGKHRFSVKVSFIEIYNEELIDLLNPAPPNERPPITIREDPKGHIYWTGVREVGVHSADDVLSYLEQGTQNRATGATDMNAKSSRSHAILSVTLKQERWSPSIIAKSTSSSMNGDSRPVSPAPMVKGGFRPTQQQQTSRKPTDENGEWIITTSKFHFVDLAGSERLKRTAAEGDRRKEGININAGLSALGNVISVLGDPSKRTTHIPYRDSKLTRLLQDSLGGNATTLMIACASPAEYNLPETLNTLQYASRARNIKNKIEKNEVEEWMTTDNIEMLRNMVSSLKTELRNGGGNGVKTTGKPAIAAVNSPELAPVLSPSDFDQVYQEQLMKIADLQRQVEELDGMASVTHERNRVVEDELERVRQEEKHLNPADFQHFVEPVIEEYEKTISGYESQRAMDRAALNHADSEIIELQRKIEQYEIVMEDQERSLDEQQKSIHSFKKCEDANKARIQELEERVEKSAAARADDEEVLTDLRGKVLRFQEMDESTEHHIQELEKQLADANQARHDLRIELRETKSKKQELEGESEKLKRRLDELVVELKSVAEECDTLRSRALMTTSDRTTTTDESHKTSIEERKVLIQQVTRLQENVFALQAQSEERENNARVRLERVQEQLDQVVREKREADAAHAEEIQILKSHLYENGIEKLNVVETPPPSMSTCSNNSAGPNHGFKDMTSKYINLHDQFSAQAGRLDTALNRIRAFQASRADTVITRKHMVLMRRVSDLERQLAKQKQRIEDEIFKFEVEFDEGLQERNEARVDAVLLKAEHDLENLVVGTTKLEVKLQKTEMALAAGKMYERDVEELRHKMDAMIIQPETMLHHELVDHENTTQQRHTLYDDYKVYS